MAASITAHWACCAVLQAELLHGHLGIFFYEPLIQAYLGPDSRLPAARDLWTAALQKYLHTDAAKWGAEGGDIRYPIYEAQDDAEIAGLYEEDMLPLYPP